MFRRLLEIAFGVDRSGLKKGLDRAQADVSRFKSRTNGDLKKAFAPFAKVAGVVGMSMAIKRIGESSMTYAGKLRDFAANIGVSTEYLQSWIYATTQAGSTQEAAMMGMQRFMRRLGEARQGTGELVKVLKAYDIALVDSNGQQRSAEAVFGDYADAIKYARDEQEQLMLTMKGMDSEGVKNLAFLKGGAAALSEMESAAKKAGQVMEDAFVQKLADAQSKLDALGNRWTIFAGSIVGSILPADTPEDRAGQQARAEYLQLNPSGGVIDTKWIDQRKQDILMADQANAAQKAANADAAATSDEARRKTQAAAVDARRLAIQKAQLTKDMSSLEAKIAAEQERRRLKAMSDAERLIALQKKHAQVMATADTETKDGLAAALEGEGLLTQIEDLKARLATGSTPVSSAIDPRGEYAVSSLARVGGGGNIGPAAGGRDGLLSETEKQTATLIQIRDAVRGPAKTSTLIMQ